MSMSNILPQRKHIRLKEYDYAEKGIYFVTICTHNREQILSDVICPENNLENVKIVLTGYGKIAEAQLLSLEERYTDLSVLQYVIMPDHIHAIIFISDETLNSIPDILRAYKSITTRLCKQLCPIDKLFQTSYYDHVIRNYHDYEEISKYIFENPLKWYCKNK